MYNAVFSNWGPQVPRFTPILDMFARSPIHPIQEHMQVATRCVALLLPFVDAVIAADWVLAAKHQEDLSNLEREADKLKKDLRLHLPESLFMAIPRGDILALLSVQDKMANDAKDVAGLIVGRKLRLPEAMIASFRAFVARAVDAAEQAGRAINELDALMEEGFRNKEVSLVAQMIHAVDDIESDTDDQQVALRSLLFGLESTLSPVDVIFLYRILESIGYVADRAQEVGGRLQLMLAR